MKPEERERRRARPRRCGPYILLRKLGQGGAAVVYHARDERSGREVALKILRQRWATDRRLRQRFVREAQMLRMLKHKGVPAFLQLYKAPDTLAMVQELARGENLQQVINRRGGVSPEECVPWFVELLESLAHIHAHSIIHRDIKPHNIIVGPDGIRLLDFGLSQMRGTSRLTVKGRMVGTPQFFAREQARGMDASEQTDIYAVGVTLYYTLTARLPYRGSDHQQLYRAIAEQDRVEILALLSSFDPGIQSIVLKAMDARPEARYQHAVEMREGLLAWLGRRRGPASKEPAGAAEKSSGERRRAPARGGASRERAAARSRKPRGLLGRLWACLRLR